MAPNTTTPNGSMPEQQPQDQTGMADNTEAMPSSHVQACANCGAAQGENGKPLSRCARCKTYLYCGTICQKEHWTNHKSECAKIAEKNRDYRQHASGYRKGWSSDIEPDTNFIGKGVIIAPWKEPKSGVEYACGVSTASDLQAAASILASPVPISNRIGFPLKLTMIPLGDPDVDKAPNEYAQRLMLDPDARSKTFWKSKYADPPLGAALITRVDGQPLHITLVTAVVYFCKTADSLFRFTLDGIAKGEKTDVVSMAAWYISPKKFKEYFEDMKKNESKQNPEAWKGVELPDTVG